MKGGFLSELYIFYHHKSYPMAFTWHIAIYKQIGGHVMNAMNELCFLLSHNAFCSGHFENCLHLLVQIEHDSYMLTHFLCHKSCIMLLSTANYC